MIHSLDTFHLPTSLAISACSGPGVPILVHIAICSALMPDASPPAGLSLALASCQGAAATSASAAPATNAPHTAIPNFMTALLRRGEYVPGSPARGATL